MTAKNKKWKRDAKVLPDGIYVGKLTRTLESYDGTYRLVYTVYNEGGKDLENVATNFTVSYTAKEELERGYIGTNYKVRLGHRYDETNGRTYNTILQVKYVKGLKTPSYVKGYSEQWQKENPEQAKEYFEKYNQKDIVQKRNKIREVHRELYKRGSNKFTDYINKLCLEKELDPSRYGEQWELDHIKPLADFNLLDKATYKQVLQDWRNVQPLHKTHNKEKWCN